MNKQTMCEGSSEQFPAHILSFSAQKNNSQQDDASAANADAANRSGATDAVSIISFHGGDQYQSAYACKQARNTMREGGSAIFNAKTDSNKTRLPRATRMPYKRSGMSKRRGSSLFLEMIKPRWRLGLINCFIVTVEHIDDNGGNDHIKHKL